MAYENPWLNLRLKTPEKPPIACGGVHRAFYSDMMEGSTTINANGMKFCKICNTYKDANEFAIMDKKNNYRRANCRPCQKQINHGRYVEKKSLMKIRV